MAAHASWQPLLLLLLRSLLVLPQSWVTHVLRSGLLMMS
jgi:hypothetical protein